MSTALDVAHLTVAFGRTEILRDVSFRVDSGTTLAIIGGIFATALAAHREE